jgi:cephalosporin hydroxylase
MNALEDYFYNKSERLVWKWHHYFDIYDKHFSKFVGKNPKILEIGVFRGGSLLMWQNYFGKGSTVVGIDIDENTKQYEDLEKNIHIRLMDQSNINQLNNLKSIYNNFDIIVDDGSHINEHQRITFQELWGVLSDGGIYLVEDTHTSYWQYYNGGYKHKNSFVEFSKDIIDSINGYHHERIDSYTMTVDSMTCYDSVIVFEKKIRNSKPTASARLNGELVNPL